MVWRLGGLYGMAWGGMVWGGRSYGILKYTGVVCYGRGGFVWYCMGNLVPGYGN